MGNNLTLTPGAALVLPGAAWCWTLVLLVLVLLILVLGVAMLFSVPDEWI